MCIEYRNRYACHCVARGNLGWQACNHRKFIESYKQDGTPETAALTRYFNERCEAETTTSHIERSDKCVRCKRAEEEGWAVAQAEAWGGGRSAVLTVDLWYHSKDLEKWRGSLHFHNLQFTPWVSAVKTKSNSTFNS